LFTYKYKYVLRVCRSPIPLSSEMRYLGISINKSLFFKSHIRNASVKAEKTDTRLAKNMPNVGPRKDRRRILSSVVYSVLLYGAPSWAHTLDVVPGNDKSLNRTQRKVLLRCTSAYLRVSIQCTLVDTTF